MWPPLVLQSYKLYMVSRFSLGFHSSPWLVSAVLPKAMDQFRNHWAEDVRAIIIVWEAALGRCDVADHQKSFIRPSSRKLEDTVSNQTCLDTRLVLS